MSNISETNSPPPLKRALQVFRDGRCETSSLTIPLLPGEQGNEQTLEAMRDIVLADRLRPDVREVVIRDIVRGVDSHRPMDQLDNIFLFARDQIQYQQDPFEVERVADFMSTLYALNPGIPEGDCGIKSTFIATCAGVLGIKAVFAVIKQKANQKAFNHVYTVIGIDGKWIPFDATPPLSVPGWEAGSVEEKWFPIYD